MNAPALLSDPVAWPAPLRGRRIRGRELPPLRLRDGGRSSGGPRMPVPGPAAPPATAGGPGA